MTDTIFTAVGLLLPFIGTVAGAGTVYFFRCEPAQRLQRALTGFAAGVMTAASMWSLLIPAITMAEEAGGVGWVPPTLGFLLGIGFMLALEAASPYIKSTTDGQLGSSPLLVLAVTMHNIPEGMAVGVVFAGMLSGSTAVGQAGAMALSLGIAIQNFPEGAIISMPLAGDGIPRRRAFGIGVVSGVVEPLAAVLTLALTAIIAPVLPYILSFAAGAMIYVIVDDLIPEAQRGEKCSVGTLSVALGFTLMMMLDVALG